MAKEANKAGPWVESKVAIGVFRNSVYMTIPFSAGITKLIPLQTSLPIGAYFSVPLFLNSGLPHLYPTVQFV
jgi:hypothetical protein